MLDHAYRRVEQTAHIGHVMRKVERALRGCEPQVHCRSFSRASDVREKPCVEGAVIASAHEGANRDATPRQRTDHTVGAGEYG
jgi:hypothetical protein